MREIIMAMPVGDIIGKKVRYVNYYTEKQRTGKVYAILSDRLKIKNYYGEVEEVRYDRVLEVCDAENKG